MEAPGFALITTARIGLSVVPDAATIATATMAARITCAFVDGPTILAVEDAMRARRLTEILLDVTPCSPTGHLALCMVDAAHGPGVLGAFARRSGPHTLLTLVESDGAFADDVIDYLWELIESDRR